MKILYENNNYIATLTTIDENVATCTYRVESTRPDLITIAQDINDPTKFNVTIATLPDDDNAFVEFTFIVTDENNNRNITTHYIIIEKKLLNDTRYHNKVSSDELFVKITDYEDTDVLNKLKNVDGISSGLIVDFVRGFSPSNTNVASTIPVSGATGLFSSDWIYYPPKITALLWNTEAHYVSQTYNLTITASDPQSQAITYLVRCSDPTVTILQDVSPNVWNVTYPNYGDNTKISFAISATNADTLKDTVIIDKTIIKSIGIDAPVIDDILWDDYNHNELASYVMTINAHDPQNQALSYIVVCSDPSTTITQTGTPNIWNVTYPDYPGNVVITYTVTVMNEDTLTDVESDVRSVGNVETDPVIDSIIWNDYTHEENSSYLLTINAHDPQNQTLTYDVTCNDGNVNISQSGSPHEWNITYFGYNSDTTIIYTITITNEDLLTVNTTDTKVVYDTSVGDTGVFGGGNNGSGMTNVIEQITISTTGNSAPFGNLSVAKYAVSQCSNGDLNRGLFAGGYSTTSIKTIEYVTISSPSNSSNFGNLRSVGTEWIPVSNGTNNRGVFASSYQGLEYVTISTSGTAIGFGSMIEKKKSGGGCSNGTNNRGLFIAGMPYSRTEKIEYITISTIGNSALFGSLAIARSSFPATSNGTDNRGVFAGGITSAAYWSEIKYVTITTFSNGYDFGDLSIDKGMHGATSNKINGRGIFYGGSSGGVQYDNIEYITIVTPGNAINFGTISDSKRGLAGCSNA